MDRNVVTATVLIAIIMVVWLMWLSPPVPPADGPINAPGQEEVAGQDRAPGQDAQSREPEIREAPQRVGTVISVADGDSLVTPAGGMQERLFRVESDMYTAVLSSRGGTFTSFELGAFKVAGSGKPVQLVDTTKVGAMGLIFTSPASRIYDTRALHFESSRRDTLIRVAGAEETLTFTTRIAGGEVRYTYTFKPETYEVGLRVALDDPASFVTPQGYELAWNGGIPFTEKDIETSSAQSGAYARSGGEVEAVQVTSDPYGEKTLNGVVDWVAVKSKYFTVAIMPQAETRGADLLGERFGDVSQSYLRHDYVASLRMPLPTAVHDFTMYMGPMEVRRISRYDLDLYDMVDYGWDFFEVITRPLAKFVFTPVFDFMARFVPNYGIVIILLSLLIKLVLSPLTKSSFRSMAKMKELQPRMEVIKEKYPDDPTKQQQAMMKMYKETGVNPLGGCLPMLLQYPIIIALWQFLPQAIEIRQEGFLWAADLSAPDAILQLPFTIPFFGDFVAGFTLLMGISMVFQMKIQMASTPSNAQAKIFTYVFPVMLFVIFNRLASGLSLYYLCYNVLTALHQRLINRQIAAESEQAKAGGDGADSAGASTKKSRSKKTGPAAKKTKRSYLSSNKKRK